MRIVRWDGTEAREVADELAVEEPLEIRVAGRPVSVTMRTPGHDVELAAGFLLTEGVVQRRGEILAIRPCRRRGGGGLAGPGNALDVQLDPDLAFDLARLTRHVFASSSCGVCGKASIEAIQAQFPPVESPWVVPAARLAALPDAMQAAQATFRRTGGLHAAALFDRSGTLICLREDVGRHNAVDKVVGYALLDGPFPLDEHLLVVSGRSSFEIMQKALAARLPVVAAVSAPSSLAVDFARLSGQTLVGFLRPGRMNVYSHPWRIDFDSNSERLRVIQPDRPSIEEGS